MEYASFGGELQRRRLEFIDELADARSVLILGDGDGRFLAEFLRMNSRARVDSVDSSAEMLALARGRAEAAIGTKGVAERVLFRCDDALKVEPSREKPYDLIVTHFFLDCFDDEQVTRLIERIGNVAAADAQWIVSDFRQPERALRLGEQSCGLLAFT